MIIVNLKDKKTIYSNYFNRMFFEVEEINCNFLLYTSIQIKQDISGISFYNIQ